MSHISICPNNSPKVNAVPKVTAAKILLFAVSAVAALGCQRLMNQDAAVQKAIRDHLSQRSDLAMDKMVMEVQQVKVDGDKAQAEVVFRVTADPNSRMSYHYDLHRESGNWKVDSGRPSGAETAHPQLGQASGESPGESSGESMMEQSDGSGGELPPGHPPIPETNPHTGEPPPSGHP